MVTVIRRYGVCLVVASIGMTNDPVTSGITTPLLGNNHPLFHNNYAWSA